MIPTAGAETSMTPKRTIVSKTRLLDLVRDFRWMDVDASLRENPLLVAFRDQKGRNWLHHCCGVNIRKRGAKPAKSIRTAEVLLDAGIDINQPSSTEGTWKATPLWYAIAWGENTALAKYLLRRGSDPNHCLWAAVNRDNPAAVRLLIENGAEDPTTKEASPLLAAIQWNKFAAADELLKLGADVNFQDDKGMTALHYLLEKRSDKKHVQLVLRYRARGDLRNADGVTAVDIMMRKRDPELRRMAERLVARS